MAIDTKFLNGPVPGSSLTGTPGNTPWENPPQYVAVEDVIEFYTERITDEDVADSIVKALEGGISVDVIAEQIVTSAGMNGVHTYDAGVLATPVVRELIMYVADLYNVDYIESYAKQAKQKRIPSAVAKEIAKEISAEMKKPPTTMPDLESKIQQGSSGLMARPTPAAQPTTMMEE